MKILNFFRSICLPDLNSSRPFLNFSNSMSCNFLFPEEFVPIFAKTDLKKSLDLFDDPTKRASVYLFLALENFAGATTKS